MLTGQIAEICMARNCSSKPDLRGTSAEAALDLRWLRQRDDLRENERDHATKQADETFVSLWLFPELTRGVPEG